MARILIVEDEAMLNDMMCEYLGQEHEVTGVKSYDEALDLAYESAFDLWIFDVKIVGGNGFNLLKELRSSTRLTPCIFTTSLNTIDDVSVGFLSGCDDYLKKPFELKELGLRVKNLLKRTFLHNESSLISLGENFSFDISQNILYKGKDIFLMAKKQALLLSLLLKNRDRFVTHDEIFSEIWSFDENPSDASLRVYIAELRKILGKERIISQSKLGYKYV
ncbi:response regulator transcription factor [Campylobacter mucosalis]|uniref:response regulator transcription factor n=1 Tax=Campylobacter mucosalis TaxID=202 RepID=UPI0004D8D7C9|nr:response regulator transcription factor [Campylobacter mucosalis]KEA46103.1 chemotaxis protein CheY [Campylobacter mucosalis]QKF62548.1 two-component system response regulator [Campylobacter mucosalis]